MRVILTHSINYIIPLCYNSSGDKNYSAMLLHQSATVEAFYLHSLSFTLKCLTQEYAELSSILNILLYSLIYCRKLSQGWRYSCNYTIWLYKNAHIYVSMSLRQTMHSYHFLVTFWLISLFSWSWHIFYVYKIYRVFYLKYFN